VARPGSRRVGLPELFLGLLSLAVAIVLTAHIAAGTIHDARHTGDTVTVTGSARKPISADLVQWSLEVDARASSSAIAARQLHGDLAAVRTFLVHAGIPARAISPTVVSTDTEVAQLPHHRTRTTYLVDQSLDVQTRELDVVQAAATHVGDLVERGIAVSAGSPAYISTVLGRAKIEALEAATADAHERAETLVQGLGGKLGRMRSSSLGVYQVTPRFSTDVTNYGVNDVSSRDKDVNAVVSATFDVKN
jgi:uncharacterized protein